MRRLLFFVVYYQPQPADIHRVEHGEGPDPDLGFGEGRAQLSHDAWMISEKDRYLYFIFRFQVVDFYI